jgi:hypothetical protein
MTELRAPRRRIALAAGAAVACVVLFGTGLALAPASSEQAPEPPAAEVPPVAVQPAPRGESLRVGAVRALGRLPVLAPPRRPKPRPPRPGRSVAPPPAAVAPPPPRRPAATWKPPICIGAGCDFR